MLQQAQTRWESIDIKPIDIDFNFEFGADDMIKRYTRTNLLSYHIPPNTKTYQRLSLGLHSYIIIQILAQACSTLL